MGFPRIRLLLFCAIALCFWSAADAACKCGPDLCFLPAEPGPCRACFPRYHYVPERNFCVEFVYGGCGGNENRFLTRAECERTCKRP